MRGGDEGDFPLVMRYFIDDVEGFFPFLKDERISKPIVIPSQDVDMFAILDEFQ